MAPVRKREDYLEQCRELLQDRMPPEEPGTAIDDESQQPEEEPPEEESEIVPKCCPRCHSCNLIYIEQYWPEGHWAKTDSPKRLEYSTYLWDAWDAGNTQASPTPAGAVPT